MESGTESDANVAVVRTVIDVCPLFANRQATPLRGLSLCLAGAHGSTLTGILLGRFAVAQTLVSP